jgi:hypothetical protein
MDIGDEYPVVYLTTGGLDRNQAKKEAIHFLDFLLREPTYQSGHDMLLRSLRSSLEAAGVTLQDIGGSRCSWAELEGQVRKYHSIAAASSLENARIMAKKKVGSRMSVLTFRIHCEALGYKPEAFGTSEQELDQLTVKVRAS